ncbi:MAG: hypothetical protein JKY30_11235 [Flavobacteriales bacterium]|nr:hypothetical protein [Flavobacteriales bacterium]
MLQPVIDYKNKFNESFDKVKLTYDSQLASLSSRVTVKDQEIKQKEEELESAQSSIEEYEYALKHSITKRAFFNFIKRKSKDEGYEKHLGLISIIRRDFEILSNLFGEVIIPENITKEEKEIWTKRKDESDEVKELLHRPLDRIILYIDDLDRCSDEKVLEVLEAVHLLMAFPLFVVVVGVDKRCVSNALKYRNMSQYGKMIHIDDPKDLKTKFGIEVIEPDEYLEKIFQIPFNLKDASEKSIKGMIGSILKDEINKEKTNVDQIRGEPVGVNKDMLSVVTEPGVDYNNDLSEDFPTLNKEKESFINPAPDDLKLSEKELLYLKEVSILVGNTPRTVKRFINIYRIIRTHEQPKYSSENKELDFLIVMFLLALGIGKYKTVASIFYKNCLAKKSKILMTVLGENKETEILVKELDKNDVLKQLKGLKASQFNQYIKFVSRFSFNT